MLSAEFVTGVKVAVLERGTRGSGQTGKTTAHIMEWNDDYYYNLESMFGTEVRTAFLPSVGKPLFSSISFGPSTESVRSLLLLMLLPTDEAPSAWFAFNSAVKILHRSYNIWCCCTLCGSSM